MKKYGLEDVVKFELEAMLSFGEKINKRLRDYNKELDYLLGRLEKISSSGWRVFLDGFTGEIVRINSRINCILRKFNSLDNENTIILEIINDKEKFYKEVISKIKGWEL